MEGLSFKARKENAKLKILNACNKAEGTQLGKLKIALPMKRLKLRRYVAAAALVVVAFNIDRV